MLRIERGGLARAQLEELGVDARVIPHPVFPSDPPRTDDGRTILSLGTIRPYKGLADTIAAHHSPVVTSPNSPRARR